MTLLLLAALLAQAPSQSNSSNQAGPVAATVNGRPILVSDVRRELKNSTNGRRIATEAKPALEASALAKLIDRELVMTQLKATQLLASDSEVAQQWDRLKKRLDARKINAEKHFQGKGLRDLDHWRHEARWELSWNAFLNKYLNEDNITKYFDRNKRHYDGTQVRVAHILWKVKDPASLLAVKRQAEQVRKQIQSQELSFAAAAKQFSQSPTADTGGDLGWMDRRKTMPESFSAAAFDLKASEISEPVVTRFGVHLIRCLEIKPGKKDWRQSREQLLTDVRRWLFAWAADQQRSQAQVSVTGKTAYWKLDDGRRVLVTPQ